MTLTKEQFKELITGMLEDINSPNQFYSFSYDEDEAAAYIGMASNTSILHMAHFDMFLAIGSIYSNVGMGIEVKGNKPVLVIYID